MSPNEFYSRVNTDLLPCILSTIEDGVMLKIDTAHENHPDLDKLLIQLDSFMRACKQINRDREEADRKPLFDFPDSVEEVLEHIN